MKVTIILIFAFLMQVSAAGLAQKITLNERNASLESVMDKIRSQTGYEFMFNVKDVDNAKKVNINIKGRELGEVLDMVFEDQSLNYSIKDKFIVLKPKESSLLNRMVDTVKGVFKNIDVKGKVTDQDSKPLPNASIRIKGKNTVTNTNAEGEFELKGVDEDAVLLVSYVGFKTLEIALKEAVIPLEIKLNVQTGELQEVKITYSDGYQNIPKERATGSFVQIDNKTLNRSVSPHVLDRLMYVTSSMREEVGSLSQISIRGISTINSSMKPLIVVDGFPYERGDGKFNGINLDNLNPNDIESITILRDAAAASIWGARAGNGVIVISTKKGEYNNNVNVNFVSSVNFMEKPRIKEMNIMTSKDVLENEIHLFEQGYYDSYNGPFSNPYSFPAVSPAIELLLASKRNAISEQEALDKISLLKEKDVRDDLLKYVLQTGVSHQYAMNLNGGTNKNAYLFSIGYDRGKPNTIGNESNRATLRLDNTFRPVKSIELNAYVAYNYNTSKNNGIDYNEFIANGLRKVVPYMSLADKHGTPLSTLPSNGAIRSAYIDTVNVRGLKDWHYKPLEERLLNNNKGKGEDIRTGGSVKYNIISGLSLEIKGQYSKVNSTSEVLNHEDSFVVRNLVNNFMFLDSRGIPQYPIPIGAILDKTFQDQTDWDARGQISYKKDWMNHSFTAILGADARESRYTLESNRKYGYNPKTLTYSQNMDYVTTFNTRLFGATRLSEFNKVYRTLNRFRSYYANVGYNLFSKYSISGSGRVDESNFFGVKANLRKVPLWSVGASWDLHKEDFLNLKTISALKFRLTYGYNGNLNNNATALPVINYKVSTNIYNTSPYATLNSSPNPGLTWERVKTINAGLDFSINNSTISGSIDVYKKEGLDLIGPILLEPTLGFSSYTGNYASMKGKGLDLILNARLMNRNLKWDMNFLLSYNIDKVTEFTLFSNSTSSYFSPSAPIVGKPLSKLYSYKWGGLDPKTGAPRGIVADTLATFDLALQDQNTRPEDLVYHGNTSPSHFGSIINTFDFKGVTVSFNISYKLGFYFRRPSIDYFTLQQSWSAHSDYALRWKAPGDELRTNVPASPEVLDSRSSFYLQSEILVERGDNIRLRDFKISYNLLDNRMVKKYMKNFNVFLYATNLGVIWKASKYVDPDYIYIPGQRSIALGLNLGF